MTVGSSSTGQIFVRTIFVAPIKLLVDEESLIKIILTGTKNNIVTSFSQSCKTFFLQHKFPVKTFQPNLIFAYTTGHNKAQHSGKLLPSVNIKLGCKSRQGASFSHLVMSKKKSFKTVTTYRC